jgi:signal transduction histidine kinase
MSNFFTDGFMPHGYCLRWDGPLLFAFIVGNLGIALAYFLIPLCLRFFIGERKDLPYGYMFKLFAAFILSCGLTHIAKVVTLYQPVYWVEAGLDLWTALVSLVTAACLFPLIPRALSLRSPKELEEANSSLQREVQEKEKAKNEAIKANQLKSQFVASVSHEIRTPMSGVIGLAEMLTRDPSLSQQGKADAQRLLASSKRLLAILNDLLDFSKLEAGKAQIEVIEFSITELLEEVLGLTRPAAVAKGIVLDGQLDEAVPAYICGDQDKIRQVLLNLISNAIKFTHEGGILLTVSSRFPNLEFSVTDTGIGIDELAQKALFQPFVQADGSTKRKYGGSGLGLSIAKQFVELMGGQIGVHSEAGQGSTFWFVIPIEHRKAGHD